MWLTVAVLLALLIALLQYLIFFTQSVLTNYHLKMSAYYAWNYASIIAASLEILSPIQYSGSLYGMGIPIQYSRPLVYCTV